MQNWAPLAVAIAVRASVPLLARRWPAFDRLLPGLNVTLGLALIATVTVTWVAGFYRVVSGSMSPTLRPGDVCLVDRLAWREVQRGDVVLCGPPADPRVPPGEILKRVVALEGDRVTVRAGRITLNGSPVAEPYVEVARGGGPDMDEVTVPRGTLFLLGDCRYNSLDSRVFGPVPRTSLRGRVVWGLRERTGAPGR